MEKVVNLFQEDGAIHQFEKPEYLLSRMTMEAMKYTKAVVILIDDRAGVWETKIEAAGMTNAEVTLSLDIMHRHIMDSVLGMK